MEARTKPSSRPSRRVSASASLGLSPRKCLSSAPAATSPQTDPSFLSSPAPSSDGPGGLASSGAGSEPAQIAARRLPALRPGCDPAPFLLPCVVRHATQPGPRPRTVGGRARSPLSSRPARPVRPPRVALVSCALHPRHERGRLLVGSHLAAGSRALGALAGSWVAAGLAHLCGPSSQVAVNT